MAVEQARASAGKEQESLRAQLEQAKRDREHDAELAEARLAAQLQRSVAEKDAQITQLQTKLDRAQLEKDLESKSLKERYEMQLRDRDDEIEQKDQESKSLKERYEMQLRDRDDEIERMKDFKARLSTKMVGEALEQHCQNEFNAMRMGAFPNAYYEMQLRDRDDEIERMKDFKARLSTKMVGEALEQHCQNEFNAMRMGAFPNAYFEKDNDARTGSKGDFIFRDDDRPEGEVGRTEVISIMFEMKNENETTATKHKRR